MSVRIGWSLTRPKPGKPSGTSIGLFSFHSMKQEEGSRGRQVVIGLQTFHASDLRVLGDGGHVLDVFVVGALRFAPDVTPALAKATLGNVSVTGPLLASPEVKRALRGR